MSSVFARTLAAPSTLLNGLTSYWKLDEASGTRVDSVGSNNLTAQNNPLGVAAKINDGCQFVAASTQLLKCASASNLQVGTNNRTWSFWVKLNSKPAVASRINIKGDGSSAATTEVSLDYLTSSDRFRFTGFKNPSSVTVPANNFGAVSTGVFYFIVAWHDNGSGIAISINNGTEDTGTMTAGCNSTAGDYSLGCDTLNALPLDGVVDACGIWNRVLTATEKASLYNGGAGSPYPFIGMP